MAQHILLFYYHTYTSMHALLLLCAQSECAHLDGIVEWRRRGQGRTPLQQWTICRLLRNPTYIHSHTTINMYNGLAGMVCLPLGGRGQSGGGGHVHRVAPGVLHQIAVQNKLRQLGERICAIEVRLRATYIYILKKAF